MFARTRARVGCVCLPAYLLFASKRASVCAFTHAHALLGYKLSYVCHMIVTMMMVVSCSRSRRVSLDTRCLPLARVRVRGRSRRRHSQRISAAALITRHRANIHTHTYSHVSACASDKTAAATQRWHVRRDETGERTSSARSCKRVRMLMCSAAAAVAFAATSHRQPFACPSATPHRGLTEHVLATRDLACPAPRSSCSTTTTTARWARQDFPIVAKACAHRDAVRCARPPKPNQQVLGVRVCVVFSPSFCFSCAVVYVH